MRTSGDTSERRSKKTFAHGQQSSVALANAQQREFFAGYLRISDSKKRQRAIDRMLADCFFPGADQLRSGNGHESPIHGNRRF